MLWVMFSHFSGDVLVGKFLCPSLELIVIFSTYPHKQCFLLGKHLPQVASGYCIVNITVKKKTWKGALLI